MLQRYTTIPQFLELNEGVLTDSWFRANVLHHHLFKEFVFKPQKKYLIETEPALKTMKEVFRDLEKYNKYN